MAGKVAKWQSTLIIILIITNTQTNNRKQVKIMDKNHDYDWPFKPTKNIPVGLYVLFVGELNKEMTALSNYLNYLK